MTTVTAGSTGTYTFLQGESLTVSPDAGEMAHITVLSSAGVLKCKDQITAPRSYGPFSGGDALSITAVRGDVDYTTSVPSATATNKTQAWGQKVVVLGDSFAQQCNGTTGPGLTLTRTNGIVTVTGATSHKFYPGCLLSVMNTANASDEVQKTPVLSYVSSSSFTYASPGPDGVISAGVATIQITNHSIFQDAGFWAHFNRFTSGGYTLVNNAGFPGCTSATVASKVPVWVAPYTPDRVIWLCGYNDINNNVLTLAQTVANAKAAVDGYPAAFWDIFATFPFNSSANANNAANLRQLTRYYAALKAAFAGYTNVRVHNSMALTCAATGLAKTGYINTSDNVHPSWRAMYECASYLYNLDGIKQSGAPLPVTTVDNFAANSGSLHMVSNPLMQTSTASTLTNVTGNMPTGYSGALTGTSASGVGSLSARTNTNEGNNFVVTYTPANADNVLRISYSFLSTELAQFTSGRIIDQICMKVNVTGLVAGNVKSVTMGMVFIADGITYASSVQEASSAASSINHVQQADMVDVVLNMRNIPVPTFTSLTTCRLDFNISHFASGSQVVASIAQADVVFAA